MSNKKGELTLIDHVKCGDLGEVTRLLDNGYPVDGLNSLEQTPLHICAQKGLTEICKVLISHGADVNVEDKSRQTPLHESAASGHAEIVKLLIQHRADVNVKDICKQTPLHKSAESGHTEIVNLLIQHRADVNVKDICEQTPLHKSAKSGHTEIVNLLIQHRADVNVKDICEKTPLHKSAESGHTEIVNLLIQHSADVNVKDRAEETPLYQSAKSGHIEIAKLLIQHSADVNEKDSFDRTQLHKSAESGHRKIVNLLIQLGADVNVKDRVGNTPLHKSAESGHTEIVKLLIQHRANVNVKDKFCEQTPLHKSSWLGHTEIVKLLIQYRADIDPEDERGNTPLLLAQSNGHRDIVKILRQAKPTQAGDGRRMSFSGIFSGYSSSTREVSIQSSDGSGQVTKVRYEEKEVRSHVTGAVSTSEIGRESANVKVSTEEGIQGHKKQELVTKSPETSSYLTASETDVRTSPALSATSEQTLAPAFLPPPSPQPQPPSPQPHPPPPSPQPHPPPPQQPTDEVTECAQKLLRVVNRKRKYEQDSPNVPPEHLRESVIVVDHKIVNHNYHITYNHCHTCQCNNRQTTREEVRAEKSETLNVSVGSRKYGSQRPTQGDDHEERGAEGKGRDRQTSDVDMTNKSYTDIQANTFRESTSSKTKTTTSRLSSSSAAATTSTAATTGTAADEIRRRLERQAGPMVKMVQSCVAGGGVCQHQSSDPVPLHHGACVPLHFNIIMQPKNVEVNNAKQVTCEKVDIEHAEWAGSNNTLNYNYAARTSSDDEDEDNSEDDNSKNDNVICIEDDSE